MFNTISAQKRRIFGFAAAMSLAWCLMGMMPGHGIEDHVFEALITAAVMASIACVTVVFAPKYRSWLEVIAIGCLLGATLGATTFYKPLVGFPLAVVFSTILVKAFHGNWRRYLGIRMSIKVKASEEIKGSAPEVIECVLPSNPMHFKSARFMDVEKNPDDKSSYFAGWKKSGVIAEEATLNVVDINSPESVSFMIEGEQETGYISETFLTVRTEPIDDFRCVLTYTELRGDMHVGEALESWFDNAPRRDVALIKSYFENRPIDDPEEVTPLHQKITTPIDMCDLDAVRDAVKT